MDGLLLLIRLILLLHYTLNLYPISMKFTGVARGPVRIIPDKIGDALTSKLASCAGLVQSNSNMSATFTLAIDAKVMRMFGYLYTLM
jgi:hypothetical protein